MSNFHESFCFLFLGPYHNLNANDSIASRPTIMGEITRQADEIRKTLGVELANAAKQGRLTISPDLWSDKFRQMSYLGLTAYFTDDNYDLHCIDLVL